MISHLTLKITVGKLTYHVQSYSDANFGMKFLETRAVTNGLQYIQKLFKFCLLFI